MAAPRTPAFSLASRTALVTGGGAGVGAEICRVLASHGAAVAVNDIAPDRAEAVAAEVATAGGHAVAVVADVTDPDAVAAMVADVEARLGPVDILVNNAGIPPTGVKVGPFVESEPSGWAPILRLNLDAVLLCVHRTLPGMVERGWGRVITIVSDAARTGERNMALYAAAKAGAAAFSRSIALEVARAGVTCNCVGLGSIAGPRRTEEQIAQAARHYPAGRLGRPADVAPAVLYLASEEASWVTAQTLTVDGGYAPG